MGIAGPAVEARTTHHLNGQFITFREKSSQLDDRVGSFSCQHPSPGVRPDKLCRGEILVTVMADKFAKLTKCNRTKDKSSKRGKHLLESNGFTNPEPFQSNRAAGTSCRATNNFIHIFERTSSGTANGANVLRYW